MPNSISQNQYNAWRQHLRDHLKFAHAYGWVDRQTELLHVVEEAYWEGYEAGQEAPVTEVATEAELVKEFDKGRRAGIEDAIEALEEL